MEVWMEEVNEIKHQNERNTWEKKQKKSKKLKKICMNRIFGINNNKQTGFNFSLIFLIIQLTIDFSSVGMGWDGT